MVFQIHRSLRVQIHDIFMNAFECQIESREHADVIFSKFIVQVLQRLILFDSVFVKFRRAEIAKVTDDVAWKLIRN